MLSVLALLLLPTIYVSMLVYGAVRSMRDVGKIPDEPQAPAAWPRLSVVVPARDEAATIEAATRAKLASDYPSLEIVVVDDRSTDQTGAIADRIAGEDPRVRVVHLSELPAGWLGKVHALDRGVQAATGDWLLFSDADVHLSPTLLRRAVATAEAEELDFVALVPEVQPTTFWLDVVVSTMLRNLCAFGRIWRMRDPASRAAVGGGTFNLVRRSVLEASPGFAWMKLEVADDVVLAQMLKDSGARAAVMSGRGDVKVRFCESLAQLKHLLEKNGFAALGRYDIVQHMAVTLLLLYLEIAPLLVLIGTSPLGASARLFALVILLMSVGSNVMMARWMGRPLGPACVPLAGSLILLVFLARAAILAQRQGAIEWRGTRYPLAELRRESRLRYF